MLSPVMCEKGDCDDILLTVWLVVNTEMANTLLGDASLCMRVYS